MFRTAILRAARVPRAAAAPSASVVASLRPAALRTAGLAQTVSFQSRAVPAVSQVARFARNYSSATAEATRDQDVDDSSSNGLLTKFSELADIGIHENLVRSITEGMKYENMTPVQSKTITPALDGRDMVAQAKTGTGKTLAFLIPVIQRIINDQPHLATRGFHRANAGDVRAIIMSPTRELAEQIGEEARRLVRGTGIVVQTAVGGTQRRQMLYKTLREGCHLLVATPGRLNDLLSSGDGIAAPKLGALVLDEADRMLDVGFDRELREILNYLPNRSQVPRQTLMFSATVPQNLVSLARAYVDKNNFEFVQTINPNDVLTHERVPQHMLTIKSYTNLYPTLLELLQKEVAAANAPDGDGMPFKAIVFLPTTNMVQMTYQVFNGLDDRESATRLPKRYQIHSKLTQGQRTNAADSFRTSRSAILFSSDVTARGMDFPNVTHVIQLTCPPDREQYVHRLGRTGRAEKSGQGWVIGTEDEAYVTRQMLKGLPLKPVSGFATADYELKSANDVENAPEQFKVIQQLVNRVDRQLKNDTYLSFLGGPSNGIDMQTRCDKINDWAIRGWGLEQPPYISPRVAANRGLSRIRGLNLTQPDRSMGNSSFGSGGGGSGRSFGFQDDFERKFASNAIGNGFSGGNRDGNRGSYGGGRGGDRGGHGGNRGGFNRDHGNRGDRGGFGGNRSASRY